MTKKTIFFAFLLALLFALSSHHVFAETLLWDDFNDNNANDGNPVDWEEYLGSQGSWKVESGEYVGSVIKDSSLDFPTYSIAGEEDWRDYRFSARIRGDVGVDKLLLFRYLSFGQTYAIKLIGPPWNAILLLKNNLITWSAANGLVNTNGFWYKILVVAQGPNIKVFVNDISFPMIDWTDNDAPVLSGKIGLLTWPGFYAGINSPTVNSFDDILVCSIEDPCAMPTPTPTPTPAPSSPTNIVIIPGMASSWNHAAMLLGHKKESKDWYFTPGVTLYNPLIETLRGVGYALNENLFIFNYDWRKPLTETTQDLSLFLAESVPISGKIAIIGHSLGGLIARNYLQNYSSSNIDYLITIGTPHKGLVKGYYLWEGAELEKALDPWQRIGMGIYLNLKRKNYQSDVQALQAISPSIKNILPIFDYLKTEGEAIGVNSMIEQNTWLKSLEETLTQPVKETVNTIAGILEKSTLRWLHIKRRNFFDQLNDRWVDGKPIGEEKSNGDNTVLTFSAYLDENNYFSIPDLDHGELISSFEGQQKILELLGIAPQEIFTGNNRSAPFLIFQLASPAIMNVIGPNNWQIGEGMESNIPDAIYSQNDKMIIIPNPKDGNYSIHILPEGEGGNYRLLVGLITESQDYWEEFNGNVFPEAIREHQIKLPEQSKLGRYASLKDINKEVRELKNFFNKQKLTKKQKGEIESNLANIIGKLNSAIGLLENNQIVASQEKIDEAVTYIDELFNLLSSSYLSTPTYNLLFEPLTEIKSRLF